MDSSRWNKMCISEQILNIGGEIQRAIDRKEKNDEKNSKDYLNKSSEWIELTKADPKNAGRIEELQIVEDELLDFFGENKYKNSKFSIMTYWDSFLSAIY